MHVIIRKGKYSKSIKVMEEMVTVHMSEGTDVRRPTCSKIRLSEGLDVRRFNYQKIHIDSSFIVVTYNGIFTPDLSPPNKYIVHLESNPKICTNKQLI